MATREEIELVYTADGREAVRTARQVTRENEALARAAAKAQRAQAMMLRSQASFNNAAVAFGRSKQRIQAFQGRGGNQGFAARLRGGTSKLLGGFETGMGGGIKSIFDSLTSGNMMSQLGVIGGIARNAIAGLASAFLSLAAAAAQAGLAIGGLVLGALAAFTAIAVRQAISFDSLKRGLIAVSGGAAQAQAQMMRLKEVAKLPGLGFREAIEGSIRLQAAGLSAKQATDVLMQFGNALATVGAGKEQVDRITLALSQMISKGKVQAEEINQISEALPQMRRVMQQAFGTADTEAIQKMGISPTAFINTMVQGLAQLPRVTGGIRNDMENLSDTWDQMLVSFGTAWLPFVSQIASTVGGFLVFLTQSGMAAQIATAFVTGLQQMVGGGGGIVAFLSMVVAIIAELPALMVRLGQVVVQIAKSMAQGFVDFYNAIGSGFVAIYNFVMPIIATIRGIFAGFLGLLTAPLFALLNLLKVGGDSAMAYRKGFVQGLYKEVVSPKPAEKSFTPIANPMEAVSRLSGGLGFGDITSRIGARQQSIMSAYNAFQASQKAPAAAGASTGPGVNPAVAYQRQTARNTAVTAQATRELADFQRSVFGGGDVAKLGISAVEMAAFSKTGNRRTGIDINLTGVQSVEEIIQRSVQATLMANATAGDGALF